MEISAKTDILSIVNHDGFKKFGQFIFPMNLYDKPPSLTIDQIDWLLPYHHHINVNTTIEVISYMDQQVRLGHTIFYDIYTEKQKAKDPSKKETGLFFFKGKSEHHLPLLVLVVDLLMWVQFMRVFLML